MNCYVCAACAHFVSVIDSYCPQCKGVRVVQVSPKSVIDLMDQISEDMTKVMVTESVASKRQLLVWRNAVQTVQKILEQGEFEDSNPLTANA